MVHDVDFRDLLEAHDAGVADSEKGEVDLVLPYPPYNVWNERSMNNSWHDLFTPKDLSDFVELARLVMTAGAHRNVFSSCMQCSKLCKKL